MIPQNLKVSIDKVETYALTHRWAAWLAVISLFAVLATAVAWHRAHDAWVKFEAREEGRREIEKKNDQVVKDSAATVKASQQTVAQDEHAISQTDLETARRVAALEQQLKHQPTSDEIRQIVRDALPGIQGVQTVNTPQGQFISVPDTPENRDVIQKGTVNYQVCLTKLSGCEEDKKHFQEAIAAMKTALEADNISLAAQKSTIDEKNKTIGDLNATLHGGTWKQRLAKEALCLLPTGGLAYLGAQFDKKSPGQGAFAGAVIGQVGCKLTIH